MQTLFELSIEIILKHNLFQRLPKYLQYISYHEIPETFIKHHDTNAINYYIKHNILEHNNKPLLSYCLKHEFIDGFKLLHKVKCLCKLLSNNDLLVLMDNNDYISNVYHTYTSWFFYAK